MKDFSVVLLILLVVLAVVGFMAWWEYSLWSECRVNGSFFYCMRILL